VLCLAKSRGRPASAVAGALVAEAVCLPCLAKCCGLDSRDPEGGGLGAGGAGGGGGGGGGGSDGRGAYCPPCFSSTGGAGDPSYPQKQKRGSTTRRPSGGDDYADTQGAEMVLLHGGQEGSSCIQVQPQQEPEPGGVVQQPTTAAAVAPGPAPPPYQPHSTETDIGVRGL
jgi:hypothetical protein